MRRKREVIKLELSGEQLYELERLWFFYGNHGEKSTPANHSFIQCLYERGIDERPLRTKKNWPTPECEAAVEKILANEFSTHHLNEVERAARSRHVRNILAVRGDYEVPRRTLER
jgi:hypothetical protein